MEVIMMSVDELIPYENNPRINDEAVKYVAESIRQFGFKVPIIIDKDNVIVAGHTRLKAALELGLQSVPCTIADDLTDDQIKAFRLADNKVGEVARWDQGKLELELGDIGMDMADFGFIEVSELDIDSFFEDAAPKNDAEPEPEEEQEIQCPHCGMFFRVE